MEVEKKGSLLCRDSSLQFDECKKKLRGLFNQVLLKYLERKNVPISPKPLPSLCANGEAVDLFELFWAVRKVGGYDSTLRMKLWGYVVDECGLGSVGMASVEFIYNKYLSGLDRWLWHGVRDGSNGGGNRVVKNLQEMLQDLMKEFGDLNGIQKRRISDVKAVLSEIGNCGDGSNSKNALVHSSEKGSDEMFQSLENDDEQVYIDKDNNLVVSTKQAMEKVISGVNEFSEGISCDDEAKKLGFTPSKINDITEPTKEAMVISVGSTNVKVENGDFNPSSNDRVPQVDDSRKRKREHSPWTKMLAWVKGVAKLPDGTGINRIPDMSKWKDHGLQEPWVQALLARKTLLLKSHLSLSAESSSQQKTLKMCPSMYEENVNNNLSVEKSRVSLRLQSVNSASEESLPKESPLPSVDVASSDTVSIGSLDKPSKKRSRIEPCYQAEIPEWTGKVSENDSKWLGTQIWPSEGKSILECDDSIGKGRPKTCNCPFPGHIECIRFHIAEKKQNLNHELQAAFRQWRFHLMGEEVSFSWTEEEEKRFKEMLESFKGNRFWRNAYKIFPKKTREELVSYYFNVFIIGRRSYQNRVTPKDVDSDDDEKEVGSVGCGIRSKAVRVPELSQPVCTENKQCFELE